MLSNVALRKTGEGWEFASEAVLENFVWENLQQLFGLTPLKQQYPVKGEICDILALNSSKQLVIIELKNTEDRYVVQQLTRYYDNLLDGKPFSEQIDYSQKVRLVAIAPTFHRHNYIDRKYNLLKIDFLLFQILQTDGDFHLHLKDIDSTQTWTLPIPYREINISNSSQSIPAPPAQLLNWLGSCSMEEQQAILNMRNLILSFHPKMQELIESKNTIRYSGKAKMCAELTFNRKLNKPIVFLWLPTPSSFRFERKEVIGRMRLWMDNSIVTHAGHVSEGMGKMKLISEWEAIPSEQRPRNLGYSLSYKSSSPVGTYMYEKLIQNPDSLQSLVNLALSRWLSRI
jgi:RecB family endonuclease NucS